MTTVTASPGVGSRSAVAGPGLPAGRVNIADRVLQKTAERAAADIIGVDAKGVHVEIVSARDTAAVRVTSPFPVPRLDDTAAVQAATPCSKRPPPPRANCARACRGCSAARSRAST